MVKLLLACISILLSGSLSFGQTTLQDANQQARQRAEILLHQLPERIKDIDAPEFRVFLRHRIAAYLWAKGFKEEFELAQAMVEDALEDLYLHKSEMKDSDVRNYQNKLFALLRTYMPSLATKLTEKYGLDKNETDSYSVANSMLNSKDGATRAVEIVRSGLKNGQDGGLTLLVFLTELGKTHPQEYLGLLKEILVAEDLKPGMFSIMSLYMLKSLYLKNETLPDLKLRFLSVLVNSVERCASGVNSDDATLAYDLLNTVYGEIQKSAPSLYPRTRTVLSMLSARVPGKVIERTAVQSRIEGSDDPLRQLILEANASTNKSDKDDLRTQAAYVALRKDELRQAAELAAMTSSEGQRGLWRDQFLEEIVDAAIKKKDEETAQYALSKMKSPLNRASVMQKLAQFFLESKDNTRAGEWMNEAVKLVESSDNNSEKARKLFDIAATYKKIDEARVSDVMQSAVKSLNRIAKPGPEEKAGSPARRAYAESLIAIAWYAVPAFRNYSQQDEIGASLIAKSIQLSEMKTAALWGIATGLFEASKATDTATK